MSTDAAVRGCAECAEQDTGPRDVRDDGTGAPVLRHLACCAAQGCPSCAAQFDVNHRSTSPEGS